MTLHHYDRLHIALMYGYNATRGQRRAYIVRALTFNAIDRVLAGIWHHAQEVSE